jgi:hypothetical protein
MLPAPYPSQNREKKMDRWQEADQEKSIAFLAYREPEDKGGKSKMADKKDTHKEFDTCFESGPFAELMQKMMGKQGIGSLCAEMMKKIREGKEDGCGFYCGEMMREMMRQLSRVQEKPEKPREEESHVKDRC